MTDETARDANNAHVLPMEIQQSEAKTLAPNSNNGVPKAGWLPRQFRRVNIEVATWPASMRREAGFDDSRLTNEERLEAIRILQARIKELKAHFAR